MFKPFLTVDNTAEIVELRGLGTYKIVLSPTGKLSIFSSDNNDDLANCTWTSQGTVVNDTDVECFDVHALDGDHFLLLYKTRSGLNKVAIWPGDFPLYGSKDPYRLYYGIDSQTLYMNVENRWSPVAYLDHDKLNNTGTLSHEVLESTLVGALERIAALEEHPGGGSGGSGGTIDFTVKEW